MTRYIVMTACAKMPSSCKGTYRRVAVVETDLPGDEIPKMISDRARGVVRIVETWEARNVGKTRRGAYQKALAAAYGLAVSLENKART